MTIRGPLWSLGRLGAMDPWNSAVTFGGTCPVCGEDVQFPAAERKPVPAGPVVDAEATPVLPRFEGSCVRCRSRLVAFDGRILMISQGE
jgi:hypothetical protein